MGRPARILVTRREMKYPTTVGKLLPKISNITDGRRMISAADLHKELMA